MLEGQRGRVWVGAETAWAGRGGVKLPQGSAGPLTLQAGVDLSPLVWALCLSSKELHGLHLVPLLDDSLPLEG